MTARKSTRAAEKKIAPAPVNDAAAFVKNARTRSTPLLCIASMDARSMYASMQARGIFKAGTPLITYDCGGGFGEVNAEGGAALLQMPDFSPDEPVLDPGYAMRMIKSLPDHSVVMWYNAHRWLSDREVAQGVANLRDPYKANQRTLICTAPNFELPSELQQEMQLFYEPLPSDGEYAVVAKRIVENANLLREGKTKVPQPDEDLMRNLVTAARGLAAFAAEQALAMSLMRDGYDLSEMWRRKKHAIEQVPGLRFEFGGPGLDQVGGLTALKQYFDPVMKGPARYRAIAFMDEIEKSVAGAAGDSSGVSQEQVGSLLSWTTERDIDGMLLIGPSGTGKTLIARAIGASYGIPTMIIDLGATKSKYVGDSGANLRALLAAVDNVSGTDTLLLGTCNAIQALSPELQRRFTVGPYFVDLPTAEGRKTIWDIHLANPRFAGTPFGDKPNDTDLTGADIYNIVKEAWKQNTSLRQAAITTSVPVARMNPKRISDLRDLAHTHGFLSADRPGTYYKPGSEEAREADLGGRRIAWDDDDDEPAAPAGKEEKGNA